MQGKTRLVPKKLAERPLYTLGFENEKNHPSLPLFLASTGAGYSFAYQSRHEKKNDVRKINEEGPG